MDELECVGLESSVYADYWCIKDKRALLRKCAAECDGCNGASAKDDGQLHFDEWTVTYKCTESVCY